jgi:hypothetical protein
MNNMNLAEFKNTIKEVAEKTRIDFPNLYLYYAGITPAEGESSRYFCTPTNTQIFAKTEGDGVHYSLLELSPDIQPVIMTVPMNYGDSMEAYNWVIAENLEEFLSLGYYNGWFPIEELCYDNNAIINFYAQENLEEDYQNSGDIQFVKKLRTQLGYSHVPLNNKRLLELKEKYFGLLTFEE